MIKFGIFDDNKDHLDYIHQLLKDTLDKRNIEYVIDMNHQLSYFNDQIERNCFDYDVLFWDIHTKDGTSLELSKRIYLCYPDTNMIYITNYDQYFKDIFDSNVLYYIDKKDLPKKIDRAVDKIIHIYQNKTLTIKNKSSSEFIPFNKIISIERKLRITYINTIEHSYRCNEKLSEILVRLDNSFVRSHNSFIINKNYVKSISRTSITLVNDSVIPISRQYNKSVKEKIME